MPRSGRGRKEQGDAESSGAWSVLTEAETLVLGRWKQEELTGSVVMGTEARLPSERAGLLLARPEPCAATEGSPVALRTHGTVRGNRAGFQSLLTPSQVLLCSVQHEQLCPAAPGEMQESVISAPHPLVRENTGNIEDQDPVCLGPVVEGMWEGGEGAGKMERLWIFLSRTQRTSP